MCRKIPPGWVKEREVMPRNGRKHIVLTSHPTAGGPASLAINWGAKTATERGPVVATLNNPTPKNCIGAHSGSYSVYKALAVAAGALNPLHKPDLTNTAPSTPIGPFPSWGDPEKIVSLDPWGSTVAENHKTLISSGYNIQPTIAITTAHISMAELVDAMRSGTLKADGKILSDKGDVAVTKAAIEPVWYLPGISKRFQIEENELRRCLFEQTGGMYPELVTRHDLKVFLPPIGGHTVYIFGDPKEISDQSKEITIRVHDECNGSDVFGSDICTCRPYLIHAIEECIITAQKGGIGIIIYNRKEGRALGEVTKFLVYNARKRQEGGDRPEQYFHRTECVAGVQDMRLQELMPDVLHWLGVTKISKLVSMSDMKFNAIIAAGIAVEARIPLPEGRIPADAQVEIAAKMSAGYFAPVEVKKRTQKNKIRGRGLNE
jgi:GTP cyclohydrolase II